MKRIFLFLLTNLAVIFVLSISLRLLGVERILDEQGIGLNLNALLVFAGMFGFGGALISLAISKWTAKHLTGAQVIEQPTGATKRWLVETVRRQAQRTGIGMPEVAIYDALDVNAFATGMSRNHALVRAHAPLSAAASGLNIRPLAGSIRKPLRRLRTPRSMPIIWRPLMPPCAGGVRPIAEKPTPMPKRKSA
jgi:heat shock protein HtpX